MIKKSVLVLFLLLSVPLFAQSEFQPTVKVGGYVQVQAVYDESDDVVDDFLIRRARIGAKGSVTENISYSFSIGASESPDSEPHMVNAYIDLHYIPNTVVRVGQGLLPFGLEGSQSIPGNPDIGRSTTVKRLNTFAMFRDRGVQVRGTYNNLYYGVAVVNGSGANSRDDSSSKDYLGQVRYAFLPGFKAGLSAHSGSVEVSTVKLDRSRLGLDAEYKKQGSIVRAEYMTLTDEESVGNEVTSSGWYVLGSNRFLPKWECALRYEEHTPDVNASSNKLSIATFTLHYILTGKSKITTSLALQKDEADSGLKNKLTTQILVAF